MENKLYPCVMTIEEAKNQRFINWITNNPLGGESSLTCGEIALFNLESKYNEDHCFTESNIEMIQTNMKMRYISKGRLEDYLTYYYREKLIGSEYGSNVSASEVIAMLLDGHNILIINEFVGKELSHMGLLHSEGGRIYFNNIELSIYELTAFIKTGIAILIALKP